MPRVEAAPAIITSKLHPPRLTSQHVPRPRLVAELQRRSEAPLTLVCAPAGSGKSTLLSEWLQASSYPGAWVSLDERDREPRQFISYVLAAVRTIFPDGTLDTQDLVDALTLPPVETLAISLNNDLDKIETDFVLVLDDYQFIANPEIDDLLFQVLRHPPHKMRLVIATRAEPPWPLATLQVAGRVAELRYADLRLTADESMAFTRKTLGDVDEVLAAVLHEESEGWVAGLQLMALTIAGNQEAAARLVGELGASHDIAAFLFDEILDQQSPQTQLRLMQLSVVNRFSASLCEAMCDHDPSSDEPELWGRDLLYELARLNLFVIGLDVRGEFFRFHHLFQHFLGERLHACVLPDQIANLHCRASDWFAANGFVEEAVEHALAAGEDAAAAELVAQHRHDLYNREQFARLVRLLHLLPAQAKERNPELLLAEARTATVDWRFTEAAVLLDRAELELQRTPLDHVRAGIAAGEMAVLHGILDLWSGNAERLVAELQFALRVLPSDASHLRGLAHMGVAAGRWQLGDRTGAWSYLHDQLADTSSQLPVYATLLQTQGFFYWLDGDLPELLTLGSRLLSVSEQLDLPDQLALAHYFLGIAHYARNELELAKQELTKAVEARFNMRLLWWAQAIGTLALTYQALTEPDQAQRMLTDGKDFLLERHAMRVLPNLGAFQAELDRQQERLADASEWAAQAEPGPLTWSLGVIEPRLAQARVLLAQEPESSLDHAALLVAEVRAFCERVPNRRLLMEVNALGAWIADRRGDREAALETAQQLVLDAEPEGWARLFVDLGGPMESLLRQLAVRRVVPHAISRILAAFLPSSGVSRLSAQDGLVDQLSPRELEILTLLKGRDSNKEIAARLYIASSTVKRHTLNIYRKLEVNDRRGAVTRATELGFLPSG